MNVFGSPGKKEREREGGREGGREGEREREREVEIIKIETKLGQFGLLCGNFSLMLFAVGCATCMPSCFQHLSEQSASPTSTFRAASFDCQLC